MRKQEMKMHAALGIVKRYTDDEVEMIVRKSVPDSFLKEQKQDSYKLRPDWPYVPSRVSTFDDLNKEVFGNVQSGRYTQGAK
jgi:hypothetical protein